MLQDFSDFLDDVYSRTDNAREVLKELEREYTRLEGAIKYVRDSIDRVEHTAFKSAYGYVQERGREIFLENAGIAIRETKEFDYPIFRDRLFSLVKDDRLITITELNYGGRVDINMETVAGNINDYAEAVKFARDRLDIGKMPPTPASKIWAEKIYGTAREGKTVTKKYKGKYKKGQKDVTSKYRGKYKKTIEMRMSNLASIAPFWAILEYGTGIFEGRGGYAYPEFKGTRFVEKTRIKIQDLFDRVYRGTVDDEYHWYSREIENLKEYQSKIAREIERITEELSKVAIGTPELSKIDISIQLVEEYLTEVRGLGEEIDERHRRRVAERIVSGDLTRTYLGAGTSVRLVRLREEFLDRLDRYIRGEYGY